MPDVHLSCVRCFSLSIVSLVPRIVVSALLLGARPAVARPLTLIMAAGSGPIRTSVRPSTLPTLFFITALGLVPIVTGTTDTDRIADSLPGVQSRNLHGVPTLPQLVAPSPPQLAPLSRRALQTVQPSDTDRHLTTSLVHSQLASSPPQQLGSSQLDSSPSPQLSSSPSPQLCSSSSPQLCSSPLPQLSSSSSPQL